MFSRRSEGHSQCILNNDLPGEKKYVVKHIKPIWAWMPFTAYSVNRDTFFLITYIPFAF